MGWITELDMDWIHLWIGLDWVGLVRDFQGTSWIGSHWFAWDDSDPVFQLVIIAEQLVLLLSNYDLMPLGFY